MVELESRNGFVYVVSFGGFHKIGRTKNPTARISSLNTGVPGPLTTKVLMEVPDSSLTEKLLHDHFHSQRVHGEWFNLSDDDVKLIPEYIGKIDFHNKRISLRKRPTPPCELESYVTNARATLAGNGAVSIRRLPSILAKLKTGKTITVSSQDKAAVRSIERKYGLKLCVVVSTLGMLVEKLS